MEALASKFTCVELLGSCGTETGERDNNIAYSLKHYDVINFTTRAR